MSERVELIIQDRVDIVRDKALSLPPNLFSGSLIANSAGDIIIEFPPPASARIFHVEAGDVIEFRSLPIRSIISKSDKVNISLIAVPLTKVDIPYLNIRKAYTSSKLLDSFGNVVNPATENTLSAIKTKTDNLDVLLSSRASESTLSAIKSKTDNLDVLLSTRASESTLAGIKAKTDSLTFDIDKNLQVNVVKSVNPPALDVLLSTRASESTLSNIYARLAEQLVRKVANSVGTVVNPATEDTLSLIKDKTDNLNVPLDTRASESTLLNIYVKLAEQLVRKLANSAGTIINPATEDTLGLIKAKTDNLDVLLSTRASEATLSNLLNSVKEKLSNVYATKSVTASANTAGLDCVLNNAHRSIVEVFVSLGGAGAIYVQRSLDGITWRDIESLSLSSAGEWKKGYMTGWPYFRVYVPTPSIDITIEMSANP